MFDFDSNIAPDETIMVDSEKHGLSSPYSQSERRNLQQYYENQGLFLGVSVASGGPYAGQKPEATGKMETTDVSGTTNLAGSTRTFNVSGSDAYGASAYGSSDASSGNASSSRFTHLSGLFAPSFPDQFTTDLATGLPYISTPFQYHRHQSSATSLSSSIFGGATPSVSAATIATSATTSTTAPQHTPGPSISASTSLYNGVSGAGLPDAYFINGMSSAFNEPITPPEYCYSKLASIIPATTSDISSNASWNAPQILDKPYAGSRHHSKSRSMASLQGDNHNRRRMFSYPQSETEQRQGRYPETLNEVGKRHKSVPSVPSIPSTNAVDTFALENSFDQLTLGGKSTSLDSTTDIISMSQDQYGCRYLQKKIDENFAVNFPLIFQSVYQHSTDLMVDPFGNYLIQKLMGSASAEELSLILISIGPSIYKISIDQHGTRACQKMIDCLSTPAHHRLLETYLSPHIVELIQDLNGNHVIQKCIQKFQDVDLQFIIDLICSNMVAISTHKHGCCVMQKLMNKCNSNQLIQLGCEILNNSISLMQDQFGNYVVQYLISLEIPKLNSQLITIVASYVTELSCQKFSSNVVEKCLKIKVYKQHKNARQVNPLLEEILREPTLSNLIKDQYGNYVVQTSMEVSPFEYKVRFAMALDPLLPTIKFTSFGKRIHNKVIAILEEAKKTKGPIIDIPTTVTTAPAKQRSLSNFFTRHGLDSVDNIFPPPR
ncbi:hypothetical protein FOA43_002837 [Brettanomyces nanus]|uniref:PUM-HD domain-containing protein n=1 Tax=Eeniella nana TaxID=13502 RepID=A0A875S652_EENNA|nr:uncharacterized protein FOA43_002837 [Brettanomyces nanus]QPG75482.1 hypothetical protein FOA43_002837 [Brettanomyces nanus]